MVQSPSNTRKWISEFRQQGSDWIKRKAAPKASAEATTSRPPRLLTVTEIVEVAAGATKVTCFSALVASTSTKRSPRTFSAICPGGASRQQRLQTAGVAPMRKEPSVLVTALVSKSASFSQIRARKE